MLGFCVASVASDELQQYLEDRSEPYASPYATVWFNHCVTGVAAFVAAFNVFWAAAIARTSIAVFKAVSQSYCVVVFAASAVLLGETVTLLKVGSTVLCVGGVVLVAVASRRAGGGTETSAVRAIE
eukprot:gene4823-1840_t